MDSLIVIGLATVSLGTIHESDGMQERRFWLRNTGAEQVRLRQGYTSCGCTTIEFPRDSVVAAGDSACITLRFNPRGKGGEFLETGTVVYGENRRRLNISLVGTCVTSEETLLRQFPVSVNEHLRLSADHFDLGRLRVGDTCQRTLVLLHRDQGKRLRVGETSAKRLSTNGAQEGSGIRRELVPINYTVPQGMTHGLHHVNYSVQTEVDGKRCTFTVILDLFVE